MRIQKKSKIIIRQAVSDDIFSIMSFINTEWKKNHILARDKTFFLYEHGNQDKINFIIAINEEKEILGLIGFIICAPSEISDVCTVIWKVAKPSGYPALGIKLLQFVSRLENVRYILSPGINELTVPIYSFLGMFTGELDHYYILNPKIEQFEIAKIENDPINRNNNQSLNLFNFSIKLIDSVTEIKKFSFQILKDKVPYKNELYFIKRYFHHPIHKYMIYGLYVGKVLEAMIVLRKQFYNQSSVLRIIDYFGEDKYLEFTQDFFQTLLLEQNCEYVDFYCYGFNNDYLIKSGFTKLSTMDKNIIPNYFSPFVQENIKIKFFSNSNNLNAIRLCKGDGDQDRPN